MQRRYDFVLAPVANLHVGLRRGEEGGGAAGTHWNWVAVHPCAISSMRKERRTCPRQVEQVV